MAADLIALVQLGFQLIMLVIIGGIAIWGGLRLSRALSAARRETAMKEAAVVASARARAHKRATIRLA